MQGLTNPDVCSLLESAVIIQDGQDILAMRNLPDFVPPEALSLFLAKKYLSAAIALKSKKSDDFT